AQQVIWDLQVHAGKRAYLELTDSDDGTAYAWMAAGRFKPPVVELSPPGPAELAQQRRLGAELARNLGLTNLAPAAAELLNAPGLDIDTRAALAQAVIALEPDENLAGLAPLVGDASIPAEWRNRISAALASGKRETQNSRDMMLEILRTSPYRVQIKLARNLAGTAATGEALLETIEHGQAPAQLLLDSVVKDKLMAAKPDRVEARITQLSRNLAPASEHVQKLIDTRRAGYLADKAKAPAGSEVFVKNCSVCHSIDGHGGLVGPQLDGVGGRGLDRLMEDVLDPSRNVDRAFRTHIITLKDGDVVSGLPRREEGELLILADSTGKEISIPTKNIQARRESETSLMPDNFGDAIPVQDFYNLMAYLLSRNVKPGH
ncbi:MAG TPA: c-type cytochrome, partial [Verrucomicrobiae bacterium]|nr:c-type cytochrome [Verrucomicrobiae bacterium]